MPKQSKYVIDTGSVFNMLTAIEETRIENYRKFWSFECRCGTIVELEKYNVLRGTTKSCGCLKKSWNKDNKTTHGCSARNRRSPEYVSWTHMRYRCQNSTSPDYNNYGGRGISVCPEWNDFSKFLDDMGKRPSSAHTLERLDVNGNYEKSNCKWADPFEQANNRRNTLMAFYEEKWQSVTEVSIKTGLTSKTIKYRNRDNIRKYGELKESGVL